MPRDPEDIVITTGPIPGSTKTYVTGGKDNALRVPFREVKLEESAKEPPVRLYDTSGPYTDESVKIDVYQGLPRLRDAWIRARGDVEEYDGRTVRPEDNHRKPGDPRSYPEFPVKNRPLRAKPGKNVSQMHYAKQGIVTPEMEYIAIRENLGRVRARGRRARASARRSPRS